MKLSDLFEDHGNRENKTLHNAPPAEQELVTTAQAAKIMGVSQSRIRQLIMDGKLKSMPPEKGRRDNMLKLSDVKAYNTKDNHEAGRPSNAEKKSQ